MSEHPLLEDSQLAHLLHAICTIAVDAEEEEGVVDRPVMLSEVGCGDAAFDIVMAAQLVGGGYLEASAGGYLPTAKALFWSAKRDEETADRLKKREPGVS